MQGEGPDGASYGCWSSYKEARDNDAIVIIKKKPSTKSGASSIPPATSSISVASAACADVRALSEPMTGAPSDGASVAQAPSQLEDQLEDQQLDQHL